MNADRLLALYERISEAPDAIARLRRFVLDLAVRGKLVEQDPEDEPALVLLARIPEEKARLIKNKVIKKPRELGSDSELTPPHDISTSWRWCRLDTIGAIVGGGTPSASDETNFAKPGSGIPWLTPADLGGYTDLYISHGARDLTEKGLSSSSATLMPTGSILFTSRAPIGYVAIAANPIATNQGFKSVVPYVSECSRFIALTLKAIAPEINARASGTTFKEVSGKVVAGLPFPLPPLAEQHRIVAKVDELMALCDRLEETRKTREETRDKLTAATLSRLTAPEAASALETETDDTNAPTGATPNQAGPDNAATSSPSGTASEQTSDFRTHARFAIETLPALTSRPDQIKSLRQTILNLAVRGRLVEQDPADEPAKQLLKRIEIQRNEYLAADYPNPSEAKTQRKKQKQQVIPPDLPRLPNGWCWTTLQQCSLMVIDCKNKTAPYSDKGIRLIRTTNVRDGKMNRNDQKFVSEATYEAWSLRGKPQPGDILITREAPMGEVCIIPGGEKICLGQRMMLARLVPDTIDPRFMLHSLRDPKLMERVQDKPLGMTVQHLRVGGVETLLVPLPPLAEQHRIVAKVDALMALCDRLEAALTSADTTRARLLEALLHEALEPASETMEAAE